MIGVCLASLSCLPPNTFDPRFNDLYARYSSLVGNRNSVQPSTTASTTTTTTTTTATSSSSLISTGSSTYQPYVPLSRRRQLEQQEDKENKDVVGLRRETQDIERRDRGSGSVLSSISTTTTTTTLGSTSTNSTQQRRCVCCELIKSKCGFGNKERATYLEIRLSCVVAFHFVFVLVILQDESESAGAVYEKNILYPVVIKKY